MKQELLTFDCINSINCSITIKHSINYDTKSTDFLSSTKTYDSERIIDIPKSLIQTIDNYKHFLKNVLNLPVNNKSYSDVTLRKKFYYYRNKADVIKITLYGLRHTYAATMIVGR